MKQYLKSFKIFSRGSIGRLVLLALVMRLVLVPFSYHSDLNNNEIWGIYAAEFGLRGFYDWLNFGNYARPDYPPLAMVMFLGMRYLWQMVFHLLWWINVHVSIFPSGVMSWFDEVGFRAMLKLPGIMADLGIGLLIYRWARKHMGVAKAKAVTCTYLFNPAVIYLSASWGQLDSVVSFFAIWALLSLVEKRYVNALLHIFISVMVKATYIPIGLVFLLKSLKANLGVKKAAILGLFSVLGLYVVGYFFTDANYIMWSVNMYWGKIIPGAVTLPFINLNAFNFWGLLLGLDRLPDNFQVVFGLTLNQLAWTTGFGFILLVTYWYWQGANLFFYTLMLFYSIFMFFPRVHERYLFPVIAIFPFVLVAKLGLKKMYYFVTAVFFLNLYHWWWFPKVNVLVYVLDLGLVERTLSLMNLILFGTLLREYRKSRLWKSQ